MDTKLTLRMNKDVIDQMKIFAIKHKKSVSSITEDLYKELLIEEQSDHKIESPIAKKYKGVLGKSDIDEDELRLEYLKEKHLK